jgi:hypothetical protein
MGKRMVGGMVIRVQFEHIFFLCYVKIWQVQIQIAQILPSYPSTMVSHKIFRTEMVGESLILLMTSLNLYILTPYNPVVGRIGTGSV